MKLTVSGPRRVLLSRHVPGFPRVILGRHTMLADLGGINMKWDETRQVAQVQFAKWPEQWKTCIGPATMELYCVAAQSVVRTERDNALSDAACDVLSVLTKF